MLCPALGLLLSNQFPGIQHGLVGEYGHAAGGLLPVRPGADDVHRPRDGQKVVFCAPPHPEGQLGVFQIIALLNVVVVVLGVHRGKPRHHEGGFPHQLIQPTLRHRLRPGVPANGIDGGILGNGQRVHAVDVHGAGKEHRDAPLARVFEYVVADQHVQPKVAVPAQVRLVGHVGQRRQVDHPIHLMCVEQAGDLGRPGQIALNVGVVAVGTPRLRPVHADHPMAALAQRLGRAAAQHAGGARQQYRMGH